MGQGESSNAREHGRRGLLVGHLRKAGSRLHWCGIPFSSDRMCLRSVYKPHFVQRGSQVYTARASSLQPAWASISLGSLPETQVERAAPSSLFDLAPDGGCLAAHIAVDAGGLLHHLFIMTGSGPCGPIPAVLFCGPFRQIAPSRDFPGVVPCGVRTFLDPPRRRAAIARPA